jgi:hypothetical protein
MEPTWLTLVVDLCTGVVLDAVVGSKATAALWRGEQ